MNNILKKIVFAISFTGLLYSTATAQYKSQSNDKSEATIGLSYYKKADNSQTIVATVKAKNMKGKFVSAKNAKVNFYVLKGTDYTLLKSDYTDDGGKISIQLKKDLPKDDSLYFTIVAKIEKDELYEDAEEQIHNKDINLNVTLNPSDTTKLVTAKLTELNKDGKKVPVKGVDLKFYVQRMFGTMPAAEENTVSTDENGEAQFTFPKNIPGDTIGAMTIVVKVEDNEKYGNVEKFANTTWGTRLAIIKDPFPRALWSPYAPWPLVITLSTLFSIVWSIYVFIVLQLRKIKKDGNNA